jgi:WD40 repeat protein
MSIVTLIEDLPEPVAQICSRFDAESNDVLRFSLFLDCYEVAVQFSAAIAIAAARQHLPEIEKRKLLNQISAKLSSPSLGDFGQWLKWAINSLGTSKKGLWPTKLHPIGEIVDGPFTKLRNLYRGHGGTPTVARGHQLVEENLPKLIPALQALRGIVVERGAFVGRHSGAVAAPPHGSFHRLLIRESETSRELDLYPLLVMESVMEDRPAQFLFFNGLAKGRARYVDYEVGEPTTFDKEDSISEAFAKEFLLTPAEADKPEIIEIKTKNFVGRKRELERLAKFAERGAKRVMIVSAPPGMGKSTLLARWSQQERVLLYLLREENADSCKPEVVFERLARDAAKEYQLTLAVPRHAGARQWCDEFFRLLNEVPDDDAPPVVVLDGLDEAERVSRRGGPKFILDFLPSASDLPGRSRWVFSIRPELRNHKLFKEKLSRSVTENLELAKLAREEVREFLEKAGQLADIAKHRGMLQRIIESSEGSPLYLSLLVRDVLEGRMSLTDLEKPPKSLDGYYERILRTIEETDQERGRDVCKAQKSHAEEFLELLSDQGLIEPGRIKAIRRLEYKRLDANVVPFSPDFMALFAVAHGPLRLEDAAGMIGEPLGKLEAETGPLRSVIVENAEGFWTIFHSDLSRYLAQTRPKLLADAKLRIVHWALRYRKHESAYALKYLVTHLCELLSAGANGPVPSKLAGYLLRCLTDLYFIKLRIGLEDVPGLRADYEMAQSFWSTASSANALVYALGEPIDQWQMDVLEDVIQGIEERHLDLGSGPVLLALRERDRYPPFDDEPLFSEEQKIPEDWFPDTKAQRIASNAPPVPIAGKPGTPEAMHEFAAFVEAENHHFVPALDLPTLAFNFSSAGVLASAAEKLLSDRHQPWIRRHNRQNRLVGHNPELRNLPDSAGVTPDFTRYTTFESVGKRANRSVRIQQTSLRAGLPAIVLESRDTGWVSSQKIASSSNGGRVMKGNLVADFRQRAMFTLDFLRGNAGNMRDVRTVAITPDGRLAAIAISGWGVTDTNDYISIWDLDAREMVRTLSESDKEVHAMAFSDDGRILAVGRHSGSLGIWDVREGRELLGFYESDYIWQAGRHIRAVAMTPDARFVVCGGTAQRVRLLDLQDGRMLRCFGHGLGQINDVAITPDGRTVAAFTSEGGFSAWDVATGHLIKHRFVARRHPQLLLAQDVSSAVVSSSVLNLHAIGVENSPKQVEGAMSSDGSIALFARSDGHLVCSVFGGREDRVIFERSRVDPSFAREPSKVGSVHLSGNGSVAIVVFDDGRIYHVFTATGDCREVIPRKALKRLGERALRREAADIERIKGSASGEEPIRTLYNFDRAALTPDGQFVVTATMRDAIRVWDCVTGKGIAKLSLLGRKSFSEGEVECLKPLPDSSGIVFTTFDGAMHLWQFTKMKSARMLREAKTNPFPAQVAISSDGLRVGWFRDHSPIEIYSLPDGNLMQSSADCVDYPTSVEWCGSHWLAMAVIIVDDDREQRFIEIRDAATLNYLDRYPVSSSPEILATARGANRIVCCTEDGQTHYLTIES